MSTCSRVLDRQAARRRGRPRPRRVRIDPCSHRHHRDRRSHLPRWLRSATILSIVGNIRLSNQRTITSHVLMTDRAGLGSDGSILMSRAVAPRRRRSGSAAFRRTCVTRAAVTGQVDGPSCHGYRRQIANLAGNLAARGESCCFLPRVLAHWYSRAAFCRCYSGATCHTSRLGRPDFEALESIGPARGGVPRDRRVRRHPARLARRPADGGPTAAAHRAPDRHRDPGHPPRHGHPGRPGHGRRSMPVTGRDADAFGERDPGHRQDRPSAGRDRRRDHLHGR